MLRLDRAATGFIAFRLSQGRISLGETLRYRQSSCWNPFAVRAIEPFRHRRHKLPHIAQVGS